MSHIELFVCGLVLCRERKTVCTMSLSRCALLLAFAIVYAGAKTAKKTTPKPKKPSGKPAAKPAPVDFSKYSGMEFGKDTHTHVL